MSKFTSTTTLDMWYRGLWEFSGPAGTVFSLPDSLYEEFNEEFLGIIPGLTWTEIVSEAASGISVAETDGSPSSSGITALRFSAGSVAISGSTATVTTSSTTGITVAEVDGSPSSSGITRLVLPNGTVAISGSTATYTAAAPATPTITVEEVDGAPTGSISKLVLPNGSVAISGSTATYTAGSAGITVAEVDGSPSSSGITNLVLPNGTISISGSTATYTPASGGLSHSYAGKSTIGASFLALTDKVWSAKKITLAADALLVSIGAYIKDSASGGVVSFGVALWADDSNDVGVQLGGMTTPTLSLLPEGPASTSTARWYHRPIGVFLTAGDYWIGVAQLDHSGAEALSIAYDTGTDKTITAGGTWIPDGKFYSRTTTARDYSIRASILS
jgi:hypothetical protein